MFKIPYQAAALAAVALSILTTPLTLAQSVAAEENCYDVRTNCAQAQERARWRVAAIAEAQQEYRSDRSAYARDLKDLAPLLEWFSLSREDKLYNYRVFPTQDSRQGVAIVATPKGNLLNAYVAFVSLADMPDHTWATESWVCESQPATIAAGKPQVDISRFLNTGRIEGCPYGYQPIATHDLANPLSGLPPAQPAN